MLFFSGTDNDGHIVLQARGETGEVIGDFIFDIYPDTPLPGKLTFRQLKALGPGAIEIDEDWNEAKAVGR